MKLRAMDRRFPAVTGVGLMIALAVLPAGDSAAKSTPHPGTVRAIITSAGEVESKRLFIHEGGGQVRSESFSGKLPLKLTVSEKAEGKRVRYGYRVENLTGTQKEVSYTDLAGKKRTVRADLQLPLVATLSVTVPRSLGVPDAPNSTVITDPDGTHRLLWSLVLFSQLGKPTQNVGFTVAGKGKDSPIATLQAAAVMPATTPGFAEAGQAAKTNIQAFDTLSTLTLGGDTGLSRLADGTGKLVSGLEQLRDVSERLSAGLEKAGDGADKLGAGAGKVHAGSGKLTKGLEGLTKGQEAETKALAQIEKGLSRLTEPKGGLPAVVNGLGQIQDGLNKIIVLIGTDEQPGTVVGGMAAVITGLEKLQAVLKDQVAPHVACAAEVVQTIADGNPTVKPNASQCWEGNVVPVFPEQTDPTTKAYLNRSAKVLKAVSDALSAPDSSASVVAGLEAIEAGLKKLKDGISSSPTGNTDSGGIKKALQSISIGLGSLKTALEAASGGVGVLRDGTKGAHAGSRQLATGTAKIAAGSGQLTIGLGLLGDGTQQLAEGLPAAATGVDAIAMAIYRALLGEKSVKEFMSQVQHKAIKPLSKEATEKANDARQKVAILETAGNLSATTPEGKNVYVLTQARLADSSHTGKSVGWAWAVGLITIFALIVVSVYSIIRRRGKGRQRHAQV